MTDLNEIFLQYQGGLQNNCLNQILHINNGETDDSNALPVIPNSSYYDIENFNSLVNNSVNRFGIFGTNIQSINAKFQELEAFVEELHSLKFNFSIICIQESWLRELDDISQIQLEDYNCIAQGKSSSAKGGLIMYIHTKYDYKLIKVNQYENWEGQLIEITGGGITKPVIMGNIYRPPRDLNVNYKQFIDEFSLLLSTFDQNNSEVIIAGDFNINLLKINQK